MHKSRRQRRRLLQRRKMPDTPQQVQIIVTFTRASWPSLPTDRVTVSIPTLMDENGAWCPRCAGWNDDGTTAPIQLDDAEVQALIHAALASVTIPEFGLLLENLRDIERQIEDGLLPDVQRIMAAGGAS